MKKRHFVLVIIMILLGLFIAFSAAAHPYDEPLTFRKHLTDDGRVIYSNIPKACFSNGMLTCQQLHTIYGSAPSSEKAESSPTKKASVAQGKQRISTTNAAATSFQCGSKQSCSEMTSCEEAEFYLGQCGQSSLDGDGDGVPCESKC